MTLLKHLEHRLKEAVFGVTRLFLRKGDAARIPVRLEGDERLLFIRHDLIGDMVVSLPVFAAIKKQFPNITIDVLCSGINSLVIADDPRVDNIFLYQKRPLGDYGVLRKIRQIRYDAVIDLINGESTSALILTHWCARGAALIGVQKEKYADYYDFAYYHEPTDDRHIIENTLRCLEGFGMSVESAATFVPLYLKPESLDRAASFLAEVDRQFPEANRVIGINLSAGQPTRHWATKKYAELIRLINKEATGNPVVVLFAMPPDRERAQRLIAESKSQVTVVPEGLSLNEASAIISKLDMLISPDTSLIHIARSFRVPVVGMYPQPPHNFIRWHPLGQPDGAVLGRSGDNIYDIEPGEVAECYRKQIISTKVANG